MQHFSPLYSYMSVCDQLTELKVEDSAISVSYGHGALEPHQDMPEYESYTGITLIHCLRFVA